MKNNNIKPCLSIKDLQKICYNIAKSKGFWRRSNSAEKIALMHSELSEALEALRHNNWKGKNSVSEELADCCIRIFDFCQKRKINLQDEIMKKIEYNRTREYKHGKEF